MMKKHKTKMLCLLLSVLLIAGILFSSFQIAIAAGNDHWLITTGTAKGSDLNNLSPVSGGFIVEAGEWVSFTYKIDRNSAATSPESPKDSTFSITLPDALMAAIVDGSFAVSMPTFIDTDSQKKPVFKNTGLTSGTNIIEFSDEAKASPLIFQDAGLSFAFQAKEKFTINFGSASDSVTVTFTPGATTPAPVKSHSVVKRIVAIGTAGNNTVTTNSSGFSQPTFSYGDYILFEIEVRNTSTNVPEEDKPLYVLNFIPSDLAETFNPDYYQFDPAAKAPSPVTGYTGHTSGNLSDTPQGDWVHVSDGYNYRYNGDTPVPIAVGASQKYYIWLKVIYNQAFSGTAADWSALTQNKAEYDGKSGVIGPAQAYYDPALAIYPTSLTRNNDAAQRTQLDNSSGSYITFGSQHYNNNPVYAGDLITYTIVVSDQASVKTHTTALTVYAPSGLELVAVSELPSDFKFTSHTAPSSVKTPAGTTTYLNNVTSPHSVSWNYKTSTGQSALEGTSYTALRNVTAYTFDTTAMYDRTDSAGQSSIRGTEYYYITFRVKPLNAAITDADAGYDPADPALQALARNYSYMLAAEITKVVDAEKYIAIADVTPVSDSDAWNDANPYNDWFLCDTAGAISSGLKLSSPFKTRASGETYLGEIDNSISYHVRDLGNYYSTSSVKDTYDEDDHDYAILNFRTITTDDRDYLSKSVTGSKDAFLNKIKAHSAYSGAYNDYIPLNSLGQITDIKTVIPYTITINANGFIDMRGVTLTDTLPTTLSFLKDPDGKPFVIIEELVPNHERPTTVVDGEIISYIDPGDATYHTVKDFDSAAFINAPGKTSKPSGIVSDKWVYSATSDPVSHGEILNINFGDIGKCSYRVTYLVVVNAYNFEYRNNAELTYNEKTLSDSVDFGSWIAGAGASGFAKGVTLEPSPEGIHKSAFAKTATLDPKQNTVYYRIDWSLNIQDTRTFQVGFFNLIDNIDDLGFGPANVSFVNPDPGSAGKYIICKNGTPIDPSTSPIEVIMTGTDGDQVSARSITLRNKAQLKNIDTGGYAVYFAVQYEEIPSGVIFKNVFGPASTSVKTPVSISITKVDAGTSGALKDAVFSFLYDDGTAVLDADGAPIVVTTDNNGNATARFYPKDYDTKPAGSTWAIKINETTPPSGYKVITDGSILLTITKQADGSLTVTRQDSNTSIYAFDGAVAALTINNAPINTETTGSTNTTGSTDPTGPTTSTTQTASTTPTTPTAPTTPTEPTATPTTTPPLEPTTMPTTQNPPVRPNLIPGANGTWIELDDDGTPLGEWRWDEELEEWVFDEYPPLGDLPGTGGFPMGALLILGLVFTGASAILARKKTETKE